MDHSFEEYLKDTSVIRVIDGTTFWNVNGQLHRTDGPAIERADGTKEYWLFGKRVKDEDYLDEVLKILKK